MGCTDSKHERPNFKAYLTTYSFDQFVLREIEENDLTNGNEKLIVLKNLIKKFIFL